MAMPPPPSLEARFRAILPSVEGLVPAISHARPMEETATSKKRRLPVPGTLETKEQEEDEGQPSNVMPLSKAAQKKDILKKSAIPRRFGERGGNIGTLPIYAPDDAPTGANNIPLGTDYMRLYVQLKITNPARPYLPFLHSLVEYSDNKYLSPNTVGSAAQPRQQYTVTWKYIQRMAYAEPLHPSFKPCVAGACCILAGAKHDKGYFVPQQWIPPHALAYWARRGALPSKTPAFCYACMTNLYNVIRDTDAKMGGASIDMEPNWRLQIGVPGEYNLRAFRMPTDGSPESASKPQRRLFCNQLLSSMTTSLELPGAQDPITGQPLQAHHLKPKMCFVETPELQHRDGSRILSMQLARPRSHVSFKITTHTTERILLTFVFREMTTRLASVSQSLPDKYKLCRLAFLPMEVGLEMMQDERFCERYMPKDFTANGDYLFKYYDLWQNCSSAGKVTERPELHGFYVFYLLHFRLNAARDLLETGLDWFYRVLETSGGNAKLLDSKTLIDDSTLADLPEVARSLPRQHNPTHVPCDTPLESVRVELDNIREKLRSFLKSHDKLIDYVAERLDKAEPFDDIALLDTKEGEEWGKIKPECLRYAGPLFPEDRKYIHYEQEPKLTFQPAAGDRVLQLLRLWAIGIHECEGNDDERVPVLSVRGSADPLTWAPSPLYQGKVNANAVFLVNLSDAEGSTLRIPAAVLFGDFNGLVWWIQNELDPVALAQLVKQTDPFSRYGWHYYYTNSPVYSMEQGRWKADGYTTLVAVQVATFCAEKLAHVLQELYDRRMQLYGNYVKAHRMFCRRAMDQLVLERPSNMEEYTLSPELAQLYVEANESSAWEVDTSMLALQECIFQIAKFSQSHLPLAYAMVSCLEPDQQGPTDEWLRKPRKDLHEMCLLERFYPLVDTAVVSEDTLLDCAALESRLRFGTTSQQAANAQADSDAPTSAGNSEPLLDLQQQCLPMRNLTRQQTQNGVDASGETEPQKKASNFGAYHLKVPCSFALYQYLVQVLLCSLLGAYRTARVRPRFGAALEFYSGLSTSSVTSTHSSIGRALNMFEHQRHIVLHALRENTLYHVRQNTGLHFAMRNFFEGYANFEDRWVPRCMDTLRSLVLAHDNDVQQLERRLRQKVDPTKAPYIYRHGKQDLFKWIGARLLAVICRSWVNVFMNSNGFVWPKVVMPSEQTLLYIENAIQSTVVVHQTDSLEPLYECLVGKLGMSEQVLNALEKAEDSFHLGCKWQETERILEESLTEPERVILCAFFVYVSKRASLRTVRMDETVRDFQVEAIRRRFRLPTTTEKSSTPLSVLVMNFCSTTSCRRRKTCTVQERDVKNIGPSDTTWNLQRQVPICEPKKIPAKARKQLDHQLSQGGGTCMPNPAVMDHLDATGLAAAPEPTLPTAGATSHTTADDMLYEEDEVFEGAASMATAKTVSSSSTAPLSVQLKEYRENERQLAAATEALALSPRDFTLNETRNLADQRRGVMLENIKKAARSEALRFAHNVLMVPCDQSQLDAYLILGQYLERDMPDGMISGGKCRSECYTLCPSCGCTTIYRVDMHYGNGATCGDCDWKLRQDLMRPECLGCGKLCLTADVERHKKRKTKSGDISNGPIAFEPILYSPPAISTAASPIVEEGDTLTAGGKAPGKKRARKSQAVAAATPVVGAAGSAKTTAAAAPELTIATNSQEDLLLRRKLTSKGWSQDANLTNVKTLHAGVSKEWYRYNLINAQEAIHQLVYICGNCAWNKTSWLRTLEPLCTVGNFEYILKRGVATLDAACRILAINPDELARQHQQQPNTDSAPSSNTALQSLIQPTLNAKRPRQPKQAHSKKLAKMIQRAEAASRV